MSVDLKLIEKLDSAKIKQEKIPFTQHLNYVLQNLRDPVALAVWCYLTSLPDDWIVHRNQLMEHFGIGRDKLASALKCLHDNHLIEYVIDKNEKGKFESGHMMVKAGHEFEVIHRFQSTPLKNRTPENQYTGKQHLQKKQNTNKDFKKKSSCGKVPKKPKSEWKKENETPHEFADAMNNKAQSQKQMEREAKHIEESETFKRAAMPAELRDKIKRLKC